MKKYKSIINKCTPLLFLLLLIAAWQGICAAGLVPGFMLPSPAAVGRAIVENRSDLLRHAGTTLAEAGAGLACSILLSFVMGVLMDRFRLLYRAAYPLLVISQTVPTIALAPLLALWLGYGMAPKIVLIVIVCFFPLTVGLLDGFRSVEPDTLNLMRAMGASRLQIFRHVKLYAALGRFFAGLRIAVTYSVVGAVIAEWIGGNQGLGVYMLRVKKSYAYDKMFAVIVCVVLLSLLLMQLVFVLQKVLMPWERSLRKKSERGEANEGKKEKT